MKKEQKARILPFNKNKMGSEEYQVSDVTRSIFSQAWGSYVDEPGTAAVKLSSTYVSELQEQQDVIYPIPSHLSLID